MVFCWIICRLETICRLKWLATRWIFDSLLANHRYATHRCFIDFPQLADWSSPDHNSHIARLSTSKSQIVWLVSHRLTTHRLQNYSALNWQARDLQLHNLVGSQLTNSQLTGFESAGSYFRIKPLFVAVSVTQKPKSQNVEISLKFFGKFSFYG